MYDTLDMSIQRIYLYLSHPNNVGFNSAVLLSRYLWINILIDSDMQVSCRNELFRCNLSCASIYPGYDNCIICSSNLRYQCLQTEIVHHHDHHCHHHYHHHYHHQHHPSFTIHHHRSTIHHPSFTIRPGCLRPSIALTVQNRGLKHQSFIHSFHQTAADLEGFKAK